MKCETNALYRRGIAELKSEVYEIVAIFCNERRELINSFSDITVQMCQFDQAAIIRRYITKKPILPASIELQKIVIMMKKTDK